jgi:flagellar hook assembly protein FlgD
VLLPDALGVTHDSVWIFVNPTELGVGTHYDTVAFDVQGVSYSVPVTVRLTIGGADSTSAYSLENYPNPFNPSTNIVFSLPQSSHVRLEVFNVLGQRVVTLADEYMTAGSHTLEWNGTDANGQQAASGVYFYRLQTEASTLTKKMLLAR